MLVHCVVDGRSGRHRAARLGDSASYTINLRNLSSPDTPDLVCTVSDPTIGFSKDVTLASGRSDVSNVPFTIPVGADDPFPNGASATCSPVGFSNVYRASDDHDVNLFQPAIRLTKTGDPLSKIGDRVSYTITLSNLSSADTPDLVCMVSDPTIDFSKNVTLASGESDISNVPFTIRADHSRCHCTSVRRQR